MSIAEARIIQARLRPNPVLSVGGNYLDILGARLQSVHQRCRANRDARPCGLCLESGGKSQERIAVVEASKAVSRLERLNSTRAFVLEVQSGATDLLLAKENVALVRASLDAFNQIVTVNTTRVGAGDSRRPMIRIRDGGSLQR